MKVTLEHDGVEVSPALRKRLRGQLLLGLGRLASQTRFVLVRIERTSDARGAMHCLVRVELEQGLAAEVSVFESNLEAAVERAILRIGRIAERKVLERKE